MKKYLLIVLCSSEMFAKFYWYDYLGTLGVMLIIVAYFLLQIGKVDGTSLKFSVANALGAGLILVSLYYEFNLPAFIIETFWLVISMIGIVSTMRQLRHAGAADT